MMLTETDAYKALFTHYKTISPVHLRELFAADSERFQRFSLGMEDLFVDFSKHRINQETLRLLIQLAEERQLVVKKERLFSGELINATEKSAALHTALRNRTLTPVMTRGYDVMPAIRDTLQKMRDFVEAIHAKRWVGATGKPLTEIVNIGIGGSDLGPLMATTALTPYHVRDIHCHFVSSVDGSHLLQILKKINPENTLFIVASKSFSTLETLMNAETARKWLQHHMPNKNIALHQVAVTAEHARAKAMGFSEQAIFDLWEWVGGRYSIWSAVGLSLALAIGMKSFEAFLDGAFAMDQHFRQAPLNANIPVILGLLNVWYTNFFQVETHAVLPYAQNLEYFPAYLQQLVMESNGKSMSLEDDKVTYATSPILWGSVEPQGQHAFHQLLFQGTHLVPCDFILPIKNVASPTSHHAHMISNALAQSRALMWGKTEAEVITELTAQDFSPEEVMDLAPHRVIKGNQPSTTILCRELTPRALGSLIAMYEHSVFVQSVIWDINPFDQYGVELGKQMAKSLKNYSLLAEPSADIDASTRGLLRQIAST